MRVMRRSGSYGKERSSLNEKRPAGLRGVFLFGCGGSIPALLVEAGLPGFLNERAQSGRFVTRGSGLRTLAAPILDPKTSEIIRNSARLDGSRRRHWISTWISTLCEARAGRGARRPGGDGAEAANVDQCVEETQFEARTGPMMSPSGERLRRVAIVHRSAISFPKS